MPILFRPALPADARDIARLFLISSEGPPLTSGANWQSRARTFWTLVPVVMHVQGWISPMRIAWSPNRKARWWA